MLLQHHRSRVCRKTHKSRTQTQRVFKTAPLYAVTNPEPTATPEILALFTAFFESLWSPITGTTAAAEKAGMSYVYDEDGTLIAQTLTGGASTTWGQSARYIYLPTASGPMPVAAIYGTKHYAIQSDHLNTPRRLIQSDGQVAWQWAYSAFGDEQPTIAKNRFANVALNQSFGSTTVTAVTFNLRYPGQYFDQESDLHYNYHRSYSARIGRYTQADPIDLAGGWNRFSYVGQNPLSHIDPTGLVKWAGEMYSINAGAAVGGGQYWLDLKSECVNNKYAYIRVYASALGAGFGIKFTANAQGVTFEDHKSSIQPEGFSGVFKIVNAGIGIGLTGGWNLIQVGNNVADFSFVPSPGIGVDASVGAAIGKSQVVSVTYKDCECGK